MIKIGDYVKFKGYMKERETDVVFEVEETREEAVGQQAGIRLKFEEAWIHPDHVYRVTRNGYKLENVLL